MIPEEAREFYNNLIPGWSDGRKIGAERRMKCPLHDDQHHPNFDIHETKLLWNCRAGCGGGTAWDLAVQMHDEEWAKKLLRELRSTSPQHRRTGSRRDEVRPSDPVTVLGPPTEAQVRVLMHVRRVRDAATLKRLGVQRVRCWGAEWLGFLTLAGAWKLWALDADGRPRRDEYGRLQRRNAGPVSIIFSSALLNVSPGVDRLFDVEGESDLLAAIEAGLEYAFCSTGGAGTMVGHDRHEKELLALAPREVVIVRDLDEAGRSGAAKASTWWSERGFPVRIVALPEELGEGGDLRNFLLGRPALNGKPAMEPLGTVEDLERLVDEAELRHPQERRGFEGSEGFESKGADEWEAPIEFDGFDLPSFPTEALPSVLRDFVDELAATYQVPIDIPACAAIGTVAAAVARKVEVAVGQSHREPTNLYIAPTAASGERKRVIRDLVAPLYEAERVLQVKLKPVIAKAVGRRAVAEERIKNLEKQAARKEDPCERECLLLELDRLQNELPKVPATPQLIGDDTTPEALGRILADQGERIAIVSEEAGTLFAQAAGRYSRSGEVDLDLWLKSYDGGSTRVGRVTRKAVSLDRPAITAIVTPQPIVLSEFAKHPEFVGRGFVARWLFVLPASLVGTRKYGNRPICPSIREAYCSAIQRLIEIPVPEESKIPVVHLEGAALQLWATYADEIEVQQAEGGRLCFVRDWASKLSGKVARIAACFHLLQHRHQEAPWQIPISEEAVAAAWAMGQYFTGHALAAYALMGTGSDVALGRRILGWIRRNRLQRFSRRDCHQAHRNLGKPSELEPGLQILAERGFIRRLPAPESSDHGGRPRTPEWEVNPYSKPSKDSKPPPSRGFEGFEGFEGGSRV